MPSKLCLASQKSLYKQLQNLETVMAIRQKCGLMISSQFLGDKLALRSLRETKTLCGRVSGKIEWVRLAFWDVAWVTLTRRQYDFWVCKHPQKSYEAGWYSYWKISAKYTSNQIMQKCNSTCLEDHTIISGFSLKISNYIEHDLQ